MAEAVVETPWTRNEFIRAQWMDSRITVMDALCVILGGILIWKNDGALIATCAEVVIGYLFLRLLGWPIRQWSVYRDMKTHPIFVLSDQGVKVEDGGNSGFENWNSFKSAKETQNFYSLRRRRNAPRFTIAKRMISNAKDEAAIRSLLRANTKAHLQPNDQLDTIDFS